MAEHGTTALSLRAVAASIGLSAPALYRYFPDKNHLITALILDAFASLADTQNAILERFSATDWEGSLRSLGLAYRDWAKRQPAAFYLIFGNPVPGYEAPWKETMPVAGRSLSALITVLDQARVAGAFTLPLSPPPEPELAASLAAWSDVVHSADADILYLALIIGTRVQGMMLLELGRQLPPFFSDGEGLYRRELERIISDVKGPRA